MRPFSLFLLLSLLVPHLHAAGTTRPAFAWSKAFGGQSSDYGTTLATDSAGSVYVAGNTNSPDFPVNHGFQVSQTRTFSQRLRAGLLSIALAG